jgi:L-fuculose-phosphate aldolase
MEVAMNEGALASTNDEENVLELKREVLDAARALLRTGLLTGKEGNLSALSADGCVVITPARKDYLALAPQDLVVVDLQGRKVSGQRVPSSELRMHLEIYGRRRDVGAIIHTHATYATVLALTRSKLPAALDEVTLALGGEIEVSRHAMPGTKELGRNVAAALDGKGAALVADHGCVAVGRDVDEALENMIILERASKIYVISRNFGLIRPFPRAWLSRESKFLGPTL